MLHLINGSNSCLFQTASWEYWLQKLSRLSLFTAFSWASPHLVNQVSSLLSCQLLPLIQFVITRRFDWRVIIPLLKESLIGCKPKWISFAVECLSLPFVQRTTLSVIVVEIWIFPAISNSWPFWSYLILLFLITVATKCWDYAFSRWEPVEVLTEDCLNCSSSMKTKTSNLWYDFKHWFAFASCHLTIPWLDLPWLAKTLQCLFGWSTAASEH